MAEWESIGGHPSGLPESESEAETDSVSGEECEPAGSEETLDLYLKLAEEFVGAVQKMPSRKFNNEQCGYLAHKLEVVVQSASSFLKVLGSAEHPRSQSSPDMTRCVSIFKLLLALAKEIESFIQSCCMDAWIQAAMTLTNVSEYVSSVGFKLELCRVAFCKNCAATGSLTLDKVDDINQAEVEVVEKKASIDVESLFEKVILELNTPLSSKKNKKELNTRLRGENRDLANYLLERLKGIKPIPASLSSSSSWSGIDDGGFFGKLYKRVFERVQQTTLLGRGASASVHEATWLGTRVAKKTFQGRENPHFMKEADILARLCHPNITSMFCCAMDKKCCSIIMELMDEDLHNLMHRRCGNSDSPPFSVLEAVDIMLQVGEGVKYLHDQKIVHGDLKSMNILVKSVQARESETGYVQVKVADFGLSKTKESSTRYSSQTFNTGSTRWMPPEVINLDNMRSQMSISRDEKNPKHPFKRDVYSFGMICYELLNGNEPFPDEISPKNIKEKVMRGERPNLPDHCPEELKALIKKCWTQIPKERPTFVNICKELKYLKCLLLTGFNQGHHLPIEEPLEEGLPVLVSEGLPWQTSFTSQLWENINSGLVNILPTLPLPPLAPLVPIGSQLTPAPLTPCTVLPPPSASIAFKVGDVDLLNSTQVATSKARSEGSSNGANGHASTGVESENASVGPPYVGVVGSLTSSGASRPVMNRPSVTVIPEQVAGSSNASGVSPKMMTPGIGDVGTLIISEATKTTGNSNSRKNRKDRRRRRRQQQQQQQAHPANVQGSESEKHSGQSNQDVKDPPSLMTAPHHNSQILVAPSPVSHPSQNIFRFQFGSFEPSFGGVSTSGRPSPTPYPLRTNSAPPNIEEQRCEQARFEQVLPRTMVHSTDSI